MGERCGDIAASPRFRRSCPDSRSPATTAVHVEQLSPRAGVTYALDESRRTIARAAYSRYAGQLRPHHDRLHQSSSTALGDLPWWTHGDHFAQASEVNTATR